jgi:hypothetical protein
MIQYIRTKYNINRSKANRKLKYRHKRLSDTYNVIFLTIFSTLLKGHKCLDYIIFINFKENIPLNESD